MPIYEYRCKKGHTFEVMQRMTDDAVVSCETCSAPVDRVFHPIAVHFKGSGFYSTDYGSKNRSRELKEAGEGAGKQSKEEGSKSDAKSDSKSDSSSDSNSKSSSDSDSKPSKSDSKASSSTRSSSSD